MTYENGEKIQLLDEVELDTGERGFVSEFDRINGRGFVGVRTAKGFWGSEKLWATPDTIKKV